MKRTLIALALAASALPAFAQTGSISGTVTEHNSNAPLADVTVYARNLVGYMYNVQTDADGHYQLTDLPTGSYWLETYDPAGIHVGQIYNGLSWISWCTGCLPFGGGGDLVPVASGQTATDINFILTIGGHVAGQLRDSVTTIPVPNITVCVYDGEPWYCAVSDANGSYDIGGLAVGRYSVYTSGGGYLHQVYGSNVRPLSWEPLLDAPTAAVSEGATTANIDIALTAGGRIGGTVIDAATRTPAAGVSVQIVNEQGLVVDTEYTSSDGQYLSARGLASGRYYVRANASQAGLVSQYWGGATAPGGYALADPENIGGNPVVVTAPRTRSRIDFALEHGRTITGHVADGQGNPIPFAYVSLLDSDSRLIASGYTDFSGDYTVTGVAEGSWYVKAENGAGYIAKFHPNVTCDSCGQYGITPPAGTPIRVNGYRPNVVNFTLPVAPVGGSIAGRAFDAATGHGMAGQIINIHDATGAFVASALTDDTGGYQTWTLRPGTYYVTTENWGSWIDQAYGGQPCGVYGRSCNLLATTPVTIGNDASATRIDFPLQRGGTISGTVRDWTGRPLAGVVIAVYDARGRLVQGGIKGGYLHTSADGSFFTWASLPDGRYYVRPLDLSNPENVTLGGPVTIVSGKSVDGISLTIPRPRRLASVADGTRDEQ